MKQGREVIETMWRADNGTWHIKGDARGRRCDDGISFRPTFKDRNHDGEQENLIRRNKSALRALIHAHPDRAREIYRRKVNGISYDEILNECYDERKWND